MSRTVSSTKCLILVKFPPSKRVLTEMTVGHLIVPRTMFVRRLVPLVVPSRTISVPKHVIRTDVKVSKVFGTMRFGVNFWTRVLLKRFNGLTDLVKISYSTTFLMSYLLFRPSLRHLSHVKDVL